MQTTSSGGVSVDPDVLLAVARRLTHDAARLDAPRRAVALALERAAEAGAGPVRGAALALAEALRDALAVLQHAGQQLAGDAAEQAWRAQRADGR